MRRCVKFTVVVVVILFSLSYLYPANAAKRTPSKKTYIILAPDSLKESADMFAAYRSRDFNVKEVFISEIGSNKAKDIRNYLKAHFSSGYLLILGNNDLIPRPFMYPSENVHHTSYDSPSATETDLYYGLLSEDIDKDGDGFPGELWDDRMKIEPDLIVGRIPFDNNYDIESVLLNTKSFEKDPPQKAVLAGTFISYPGETYLGAKIYNGDGAREEELISKLLSVKTVKLYDKKGSFPSIYHCDFPLNEKNFYSVIKDAGFTDWVAHGNPYGAYNTVWTDSNGNGIPDEDNSFDKFIYKKDLPSKVSGIFFSGSCLNEHGKDNLGIALLKKGAVSFLGSTEISFSPSYFTDRNDGGTGSINYYFVKNLISGKTVGESLYNSFEYFFNNLLFADLEDPVEGSLMDIYDYNIYGDPALKWNIDNPAPNGKSELSHKKSDIGINFGKSKNLKIVLSVPRNESFFFAFPHKNFFVDSVSVKGAIIDNGFGIIRFNNSLGDIVITGRVRGNTKMRFYVLTDSDEIAENYSEVNGYDFIDVDFDGKIANKDYEIFCSSFGKTYMDKGFNKFCDLNFDRKVDGSDLILFCEKQNGHP